MALKEQQLLYRKGQGNSFKKEHGAHRTLSPPYPDPGPQLPLIPTSPPKQHWNALSPDGLHNEKYCQSQLH